MEALEFGAHLHAQLGIEVGERLVHQKGARIAHQRPAERHALLLAARQLARPALEQVHDVEHLGGVHYLLFDLGARQLPHLQRKGEVLEHCLVGIERVVLEHHGDVPILGIEIVDHAVADIGCRRRSSGSSPAMRFSVVVLPQPEGPTSATNSPSSTVSETWFTAKTLP